MEHIQPHNPEQSNLKDIARAFESQIKSEIATKFSVVPEDLSLWLEADEGVFISPDDPKTLCCMVFAEKSGYIYIVTGQLGDNGTSLSDLKSAIAA